MPNIKTYEAGEVGLTPSDRGIAAFREAGGEAQRAGNQIARDYSRAAEFTKQGIDSVGNTIGKLAQDYENHQDTLATTDAMQKEADFDLQQHTALDNIMSPRPDPTDPTGERKIAPAINQAGPLISERLQAWKDSREELRGQITNDKARTQFDRNTGASYKAYANKAYGIESELNYQAAGGNLVKAAQTNAGVVYADPNQLDQQLGKLHDQIDTVSSSMNMTATNRMKFKTEFEQKSARALIESAIEGSARLGDNGRQHALDLVNSGKYDQWIGTDKEKLVTHINAMERSAASDQAAQRKVQQQQEKDQALAHTDKYVQDAASQNPQMKMTDLMTDPAYKNRPDLRKEAAGVLETFRKIQSQDMNTNPMVSHKTTLDLINNITSDPSSEGHITDRRQIDQEFIQGHLTKQDYSFALGQFQKTQAPIEKELNSQRNEFFKSQQRTLDPTMAAGMGPSALGTARQFDAKKFAMEQEAQLRTEGKDPRSLYDRSSPNYIGPKLAAFQVKPKDAQDFQKSMEKDLGAALQKYAPGAVSMINPASAPSGTPMEIAQKYLGANEGRDHEVLSAFLNKAGGTRLDPLSTAWCARFMNSALASAGYQTSGSDMARSFLNVGTQVQPGQAQQGDVIVFPRGAPGSGLGHVGFIKAIHGDTVEVLAGNQGNSVSVKEYSLSSALGIRRMSPRDIGSSVPNPGTIYGTQGGEPYAQAPVPRGPASGTPTYPKVNAIEDTAALKPGTQFIIPSGKYKGMIGTVPQPQVPISR